LTHQISWRIDSLDTLVDFHHRFRQHGVRVQQEVTHGNAFGIYFFDPEGNRNEVYLQIERDVRQPFRKSLDLDLEPEQIFAQARPCCPTAGPPTSLSPDSTAPLTTCVRWAHGSRYRSTRPDLLGPTSNCTSGCSRS
jgi:hypothetical protein